MAADSFADYLHSTLARIRIAFIQSQYVWWWSSLCIEQAQSTANIRQSQGEGLPFTQVEARPAPSE